MDQRQTKWVRARIVRLAGVGLATALAALGIAGATWNFLAIRHDRRANPPPGHIYDVNGYAMHLYCTGTGSPTVLLEAGHGEDFTVWGKVQPGLSLVTRTCSYDRAGFGWSDAQPGARDAVHIADQLHALLIKADIRTPIVLVGHSGGGLYTRVYASRFPQGVAGLVLIDASTPNPLPEPPFSVAMDHHSSMEFAFVKATVMLGIARLMGECDYIPLGLEAYTGWIKASECDYPQLDAYVREDQALDDPRKQASRTGPFGNLPILILSQDPKQAIPALLSKRITLSDWASYTAIHDREQAAYLLLSTQSRRVIATGSGHYIHYDRPDLVIRETTILIKQLRADDTSPRTTDQ